MPDTLQISGNGQMQITGVIYVKKGLTQISGNGEAAVDTLGGSYVCDTAQISGNGDVRVDLGTNNPPPIKHFGLVEGDLVQGIDYP